MGIASVAWIGGGEKKLLPDDFTISKSADLKSWSIGFPHGLKWEDFETFALIVRHETPNRGTLYSVVKNDDTNYLLIINGGYETRGISSLATSVDIPNSSAAGTHLYMVYAGGTLR